MTEHRRLPRRGVGLAVLGVGLAVVLVLPAWFVLMEEARGPARPPPTASAAPTFLAEHAPSAGPEGPPEPVFRSLPALTPTVDADTPALVQGRVIDATGQPLGAIQVQAHPLDELPQRGLAQGAVSDANGRFQLTLAPGAWLVSCEGGVREELCRVLPGSSGRELELLAQAPPPRVALRVTDPQGRLLDLPALLARLTGPGHQDGASNPDNRGGAPGPSAAKSEGRGQIPEEGGVLLRALPGATDLAVWPGDPRWLPWRGPVPSPLEVRLRRAPGLELQLRLDPDQERVDLQAFDAATGAVLAQRIGLGLPAPPDADEEQLLWTGPGQPSPLPARGQRDTGREIRLVLGLPQDAPRTLRLVAIAHLPLRHGQPPSSARHTVELTVTRDANAPPPALDLRR